MTNIGFLLAFVFAILIGTVFYYAGQSAEPVETIEPAPEAQEVMQLQQDEAVFSDVVAESYENGVVACEALRTEQMQANCMDSYYLYRAKENSDASFCEDSSAPDACKEQLSAIVSRQDYKVALQEAQETGNPEECGALDDGQAALCTSRYYATLALEAKDSSYCDMIVIDEIKEECMMMVGI